MARRGKGRLIVKRKEDRSITMGRNVVVQIRVGGQDLEL